MIVYDKTPQMEGRQAAGYNNKCAYIFNKVTEYKVSAQISAIFLYTSYTWQNNDFPKISIVSFLEPVTILPYIAKKEFEDMIRCG